VTVTIAAADASPVTVTISAAHAPAGLRSLLARLETAGWRIDEVRISPRILRAAHTPTTR